MTNFFSLADLGLITDPSQLIQQWLSYIQLIYPDYAPSTSSLEYVQALVFASWASNIAYQASAGGTELFTQFGQQLFRLPMLAGTQASAVLSVSALDTVGHTIPVGTQFLLDGTTGFVSTSDTVIPAGSTAASLTVTASGIGTAGNGLGSLSAVVNQYFDWAGPVSVVAISSGGSDSEDPDAYLVRLAETIQLMAPRPITASDYAIFAQSFIPAPGTDQQDVGRATAIDGYDPIGLTYNNQREVTVCVTDASGNALNSDTMAAIQTWLRSMREANFLVYVVAPNYIPVYVKVSVVRDLRFDALTVQTAIQTALVNFLSPSNWGLPDNQGFGWNNTVSIYQSVVEAAIQGTPGVDHVVTGTLGVGLAASPTSSSDLALTGAFPLPTTNAGATVPLSAITIVN